MDNGYMDGNGTAGVSMAGVALLLDAASITADNHPYIKAAVWILGIALTIVSLINQTSSLYSKAQSWQIIIEIKHILTRKK